MGSLFGLSWIGRASGSNFTQVVARLVLDGFLMLSKTTFKKLSMAFRLSMAPRVGSAELHGSHSSSGHCGLSAQLRAPLLQLI